MSTAVRSQPARDHAVSIDWWVDDATLFIDVSGELCAWSSPIWYRSVQMLVATQGVSDAVISMRGVTFLDAKGVSALLLLRRRLLGAGFDLSVGALSPRVARVLELSGLDGIDGRRILPRVD